MFIVLIPKGRRPFIIEWVMLYACVTVVPETSTTTILPQPFYSPLSGTTRVSRCQKRTSGLYGARED